MKDRGARCCFSLHGPDMRISWTYSAPTKGPHAMFPDIHPSPTENSNYPYQETTVDIKVWSLRCSTAEGVACNAGQLHGPQD
jgi:hypothetical protein